MAIGHAQHGIHVYHFQKDSKQSANDLKGKLDNDLSLITFNMLPK